ncbi:SOS-response transcriptional repressor LexA [Providencia alcalifaciens]|nr:SOS-response transcriptional repressor LexA [Providencia alcalifaciens]
METAGERIKRLRKITKTTQKDLGIYCGVSDVAVGYWERDLNLPNGDALIKLAKFFNTSEAYILYGIPEKSSDSVISTIQKIPVLSYVQAGQFTDYSPESIFNDDLDYIETSIKVSPNAFSLIVKGDSMTNPLGMPSIPEGALVIVDPALEPVNGKFVVARLSGSNEVTVKKLVIDGPNKFLFPLNPRYPNIPINGNCEIVGVVRGVQFEL